MAITNNELIEISEHLMHFARSPRKFALALMGFAARKGIPLSEQQMSNMLDRADLKGKHLGRNSGGKKSNPKAISLKPGLHFYMTNRKYPDAHCSTCKCSLLNKPMGLHYEPKIAVSHDFVSNDGGVDFTAAAKPVANKLEAMIPYCPDCFVIAFGYERCARIPYFRHHEKKRALQEAPLAKVIGIHEKRDARATND